MLFIFIIFLINCYNSKISRTVNKDRTSDVIGETDENIDDVKKEISTREFVYLFFDRAYFIKKEVKPVIKKVNMINANDYKVIIDWQVQGVRKIKLKNIKTNQEYIISEGDNSGKIILLERTLKFYTFKIDNTIIKVKR